MSREAQLHALLLSAFGGEAFRSHVELRYPEVAPSLPGRDAPPDRLVADAIVALQQHKLITPRFFDELAEARPGHKLGILAIWRAWPRDELEDRSQAALQELVFVVEPSEAQWLITGPTSDSSPHLAPNPLHDDEIQRDLRLLHASSLPVAVDRPNSAGEISEIARLARRLGARLTNVLLSADARATVCERVAGVNGATRLTIRVSEGPLADAALALPWELLMPEPDRFAVEDAKLALVRDATKPGAPRLNAPAIPLAVAATIAAPEDLPALRYEDEAYRLLKALAPVDTNVAFAELGELDELVLRPGRVDPFGANLPSRRNPDLQAS